MPPSEDIYSDPAAVTAYDRWYDEARGHHLFTAELACLRPLVDADTSSWIEIGVGSGRFAAALGIPAGIDRSPAMIALARRQGIEATVAAADAIPEDDESVGGVLMVMTACFIADMDPVLAEIRRVLAPEGRLVLAEVNAAGPLGRRYAARRAAGDPWYRGLVLRDAATWGELMDRAGWSRCAALSGLYGDPKADVTTQGLRPYGPHCVRTY
ncbi:MAG: class I SAM-dependent methyltransferase, partial [Planctomycetota bacterium]